MMENAAKNSNSMRTEGRRHRVDTAMRLGLAMVCLLLAGHVATAQDDERPKSKVPPLTAEREAAAMDFVQEHQPELARLLDYLRRKQPRQYQRAVRELARTAERLKLTRERDPNRYELELQAWQTRSRFDLLAAKWQVQPDEKIKERLRAAIVEQVTLQKQILERERDKVAQRLKTVEAQLERLSSTEQEEIERRLKAATEGRPRARVPQRNGAAGPDPSKKDGGPQKNENDSGL